MLVTTHDQNPTPLRSVRATVDFERGPDEMLLIHVGGADTGVRVRLDGTGDGVLRQLPLPDGRGLELSPKGVSVWVADIRATNPYHSARSGTPLLTMQTGVVGCPQSSYPDSWHGKRVMIALSDSSCCLSGSALPFQASDTSNKTMDQQDINISVRTRAIPPHPFGWGLLAQSVEVGDKMYRHPVGDSDD